MASGPRAIDRLAAMIAHVFYRVDVVGVVPPDGPLLLLPNHPNALLDPALVMASAGRSVRFLAKSTLFDGPLRPLLTAAAAIPVYRKQDGVDTSSNESMFAAVHAALSAGEAVCIFPEGVSHSSGKLEPLRTGAARMALSAASAGVDLRLVAVGINLEQKTAFRSRATVAYGPAFHVEAPPGADPVKRLTDHIAFHMRALLVEADPHADALLVDRVNRLYRSEREVDGTADADLARRRAIADAIHALRAERPEWYEAALIQLRRYDERLRRFGLHDAALDWEVSGAVARKFVAREVPLAILLVPIAVSAALVFAVPYGLTSAAARVTNDMDVTATAKVVGGVVIYSVWIALLGGLAWWLAGPAVAIAMVVGCPLLAITGLFAIERETSAWRTARAWLALRGARGTTRAAFRRRRAELAGVLEEVNGWMTSRGVDAARSADHLR